MVAMALTDAWIGKVKPKTTRVEIPDGRFRPLSHRPAQWQKSWAVRYRFDGKSRKDTIGKYPTLGLASARTEATALLQLVMAGLDPQLEEKRKAEAEANASEERMKSLMSVVFPDYLTRGCKGNSSNFLKEKERLWRQELQPRFADKTITEVTRSDIVDMIDKIVDREKPVWANRVLSMTNTYFNWLLGRGKVPFSPGHLIPVPSEETDRERVLNHEEVRLFWLACGEIGYPFGSMGKVLLLTGTRLRETAEATWKEFGTSELAGTSWKMPGVRTKNNTDLTLPLPHQLIALFKSLPVVYTEETEDKKSKPSKYLFTTTADTPVSGFSKAKTAIKRKMLEIAKREAQERGEDPDDIELSEDWRFHDLRRTAASYMAACGHLPHVVEAVLNHSEEIKGIAKIYNQFNYLSQKEAALKDWANLVDDIVAGREKDRVVPMFRGDLERREAKAPARKKITPKSEAA